MKADELKTNLQLIQKRQKVEIKVTKKKNSTRNGRLKLSHINVEYKGLLIVKKTDNVNYVPPKDRILKSRNQKMIELKQY